MVKAICSVIISVIDSATRVVKSATFRLELFNARNRISEQDKIERERIRADGGFAHKAVRWVKNGTFITNGNFISIVTAIVISETFDFRGGNFILLCIITHLTLSISLRFAIRNT
jgi:hypothetical protein